MKLFTSSWCAPCAVVKNELSQMKHTVEIIDIESQRELAIAAGVRSVPSLLTGDGRLVIGSSNILDEIRKAYKLAD